MAHADPNVRADLSDDSWNSIRRHEAWAGEVRVNLIRLLAILAFYGQHLVNYYFLNDGSLTVNFHAAVTAVIVAWSASVIGLYVCLARRWLPGRLPYVVVAWDLINVVMLASLGGGPQSPLILLLFLVIASTPLRLSLPLVHAATLGAIAAYALALGYYAYVQIGYETYYARPEVRIPRSTEIIFVLALLTVGFLAGQSVRQVRRLAQRVQED